MTINGHHVPPILSMDAVGEIKHTMSELLTEGPAQEFVNLYMEILIRNLSTECDIGELPPGHHYVELRPVPMGSRVIHVIRSSIAETVAQLRVSASEDLDRWLQSYTDILLQNMQTILLVAAECTDDPQDKQDIIAIANGQNRELLLASLGVIDA